MTRVVVTDHAFGGLAAEAARQAGVSVANVPGYGSDTVADHTVACLLTLLRKLPASDRRVREDGWCAPRNLGSLPGFGDTTTTSTQPRVSRS